MVSEALQTGMMPYLKFINSIVLLLLNYSNASVSLPQAMADRDYDFLAITLAITAGLCLTLFAAGYGLSRLFKLNQAERVSLMFGLGMNNNGTGLVLANPSDAHLQTYSWYVDAHLRVCSFVDVLPDGSFGGVPAPVLRLALDGERASLAGPAG